MIWRPAAEGRQGAPRQVESVEGLTGESVTVMKTTNPRQTLRLRQRQLSLTEELQCEDCVAPTKVDLERLSVLVREALESGPPAAVKALIGSLFEVRVTSKNAIYPVYKVPAGVCEGDSKGDSGPVRAPTPMVEVSGLEPPTPTLRT